jgi:hypothetical protein
MAPARWACHAVGRRSATVSHPCNPVRRVVFKAKALRLREWVDLYSVSTDPLAMPSSKSLQGTTLKRSQPLQYLVSTVATSIRPFDLIDQNMS